MQRKIFPYQWGRTNGLWYCLVKKLIDIYSYGPSFAHLPVTLIGVRPSDLSHSSINKSITCPFSPFCFCPMALPIPNVLVVGHSFLQRLHSDLQCKFDHRAAVDFDLSQTATFLFMALVG